LSNEIRLYETLRKPEFQTKGQVPKTHKSRHQHIADGLGHSSFLSAAITFFSTSLLGKENILTKPKLVSWT